MGALSISSALLTDLAHKRILPRDLKSVVMDVVNMGLPSIAGGSAISLSATDPYGQSLGR
jgi:hypothetical protein